MLVVDGNVHLPTGGTGRSPYCVYDVMTNVICLRYVCAGILSGGRLQCRYVSQYQEYRAAMKIQALYRGRRWQRIVKSMPRKVIEITVY